MAHSSLSKKYKNLNWDKVIEECDANGDGVIDF
jgi:hypothetical protein